MRYATKDQFLWVHGYCTWCWNEVEPPKQNWCGRECVDEYLVRRSAGDARRAVLKRDKGKCAACSLDTMGAAGRLWELFHLGRWAFDAVVSGYAGHPSPDAILGRLARGSVESALWDMDHVLPVKDGGGGCGLDNLQTLCIWCHDDKTHRREATGSQVEMSL